MDNPCRVPPYQSHGTHTLTNLKGKKKIFLRPWNENPIVFDMKHIFKIQMQFCTKEYASVDANHEDAGVYADRELEDAMIYGAMKT